MPDQHTNFIGTSNAYLAGNADTAKAFITASQRGYDYAIAHPDEATDILVAANADMLLDRDFVRASLEALIDGHYIRGKNGAIGTIDPAKMEAIGTFLFDAGILKDGNGAPVTAKPDFTAYYANDYLDTAP